VASILLESGKEIFDQVSSFIEVPVVNALLFVVVLGWNHDLLACVQLGY